MTSDSPQDFGTTTGAASALSAGLGPCAWMHKETGRYDVIHDTAKAMWLKAWPKQVEHYTIPLYLHEEMKPLTTEDARALIKISIGVDPILDGNLLKLLRAVERIHGIGPNG